MAFYFRLHQNEDASKVLTSPHIDGETPREGEDVTLRIKRFVVSFVVDNVDRMFSSEGGETLLSVGASSVDGHLAKSDFDQLRECKGWQFVEL